MVRLGCVRERASRLGSVRRCQCGRGQLSLGISGICLQCARKSLENWVTFWWGNVGSIKDSINCGFVAHTAEIVGEVGLHWGGVVTLGIFILVGSDCCSFDGGFGGAFDWVAVCVMRHHHGNTGSLQLAVDGARDTALPALFFDSEIMLAHVGGKSFQVVFTGSRCSLFGLEEALFGISC